MSDALRDVSDAVMAFDIDGPKAVSFPFAARLARENGWTRLYAERVVTEYKRYLILAMTVGRPMTPSEDVDQAWHLHLSYTHSYWTRLCGEILQSPIHHNPTQGGPAEHDKHVRQYDDTLAAYRKTFGHDAPADIWPAAAERFGPDAEGVRVVPHCAWVVSKRPVKTGLLVTAAGLALVVSLGCAGGMNPFELQGVQYLWFLIPTMIAAIVVGNIIWKIARGPAELADDVTLTWEQAAYLAGQKNRLATAAITRLVDRQYAAIDGNELVKKTGGPEPTSPVEKAVWKQLPIGRTDRTTLGRVATEAEAAFAAEIYKLEEDGLAVPAVKQKSIALAGTLPLILVILGLGLPRLVLGVQAGKPVMYLVITLIVASVIAFCMTFAPIIRTRKGDAALKKLQTAHVTLKKGSAWNKATPEGLPAGTTAAMAVALFGTAVLAGSPLDRLKQWYPHQTSDAGGSGCGTGCGGGGGGGGGDGGGSGCGGCGGGGD